jgi:D-glycero-D-manno-heptose 1,7-bisphosphate phosphatase|tara:strand:- start:725 stop:1225 length:501 start_codon:yes stop_codon:yes gene_type:complete
MLRPAIFLDRDGVINKDKGYIYKIDDFEWVEGAKESIKYLNDKGYYIFVVTNQSGIARGYYTIQDVILLHNYISDELNTIKAHIDEFFISPYHPINTNEYLHLSHLRKPETGMLDLAANKWSIDKSKSFLIGDKSTDMECAENFRIKGYLFKNGNLLDFIKTCINI